MEQKIELKSVNISVQNYGFSSIELKNVNINLEFDTDQLTDDFFRIDLESRDYYVSDEEPDIGDYEISELKNELEGRGYHVLDEVPDEPHLGFFSDDELLQEIDYRDLTISSQDLGWYLKAGQFDEFLIHLERANPVEFNGISRMKLSK